LEKLSSSGEMFKMPEMPENMMFKMPLCLKTEAEVSMFLLDYITQ